jgi:hypothetical protein
VWWFFISNNFSAVVFDMRVCRHFFSLLLLYLFREVLSTLPPGISSENGYLVQIFYKYAPCDGERQEKLASAMNTCIQGALRGESYGSRYAIFTFDENGDVEVNLYEDYLCQKFAQYYETIKLNACSQAGDSAYSFFSQSLPDFQLTDAIVSQVVYNNSYSAYTEDACDHTNQTILTYGLYSQSCFNNCYSKSGWIDCRFDYCVDGILNSTYYTQGSSTCGGGISEWKQSTSNCAQEISCYKGDREEDDDELSGGAIAGIVIGCVGFAAVVSAVVYYFVFYLPSGKKSRSGGGAVDLTASLNAEE